MDDPSGGYIKHEFDINNSDLDKKVMEAILKYNKTSNNLKGLYITKIISVET